MLLRTVCAWILYLAFCTYAQSSICASTNVSVQTRIDEAVLGCSPPKSEVRGTEDQPLFVSAVPPHSWSAIVETWAPAASAVLVAVTLCLTLTRQNQERKAKDSKHFMDRAFDLAKRAYQEMHESHCEFRYEEGGKPKVMMTPKRDADLWETVAGMLKEACLLRTSVTEATHQRTYDAEIGYWRLKFSQMLKQGYPRPYYGARAAELMAENAFRIKECYLVPIYRFAALSTDIPKVQGVKFDDNELLSFDRHRNLPGLRLYIRNARAEGLC